MTCIFNTKLFSLAHQNINPRITDVALYKGFDKVLLCNLCVRACERSYFGQNIRVVVHAVSIGLAYVVLFAYIFKICACM